MSGGRFNYLDRNLKVEIYGYTDKPSNVFEDKEISGLVWDVLDLIHNYDWYVSGDTCEETYLNFKRIFKEKWLSNDPLERVKRIIDEAISECKEELYKTYNVERGAIFENVHTDVQTYET